MRIYLDNNTSEECFEISSNGSTATIDGNYIFNYQAMDAYIEFTSTPAEVIINNSKKLKRAFLKATEYKFFKQFPANRELGLYAYRNAKAELSYDFSKDFTYSLKIYSDSWEGITDMKELQQKIFAGSILPTISYELEQKKSLVTVFKQLVAGKNLSKFQRFILALRMTAQRA